MAEAFKVLGFTALLALFFAMAWGGTWLLRSDRWADGAVALGCGILFLAIYAWLGQGFHIMNEDDLASARARYDQALQRYKDAGPLRNVAPSREERLRREREERRIGSAERGVMLSRLASYAALVGVPLAVLGGLVWPRRPLPPRSQARVPKRRWSWRRPFTLVELLIVAALIGVISALTTPAGGGGSLAAATTVRQAAVKLELLKPRIAEYRRTRQDWPRKNGDLGLPEAGFLESDWGYSFDLQGDGGLLLKTRFGNVSFRPALDGKGEIAWLCAHEPVPEGFRVFGENRTSLATASLPGECRK